MSTVHYIVQIDINGKTYDTSLIMKTESIKEIEAFKNSVTNEKVHFLHITKTDDKYDGYIIDVVQPIVKPIMQLDKDLDEILALKQINYTFSKEIILDAKQYIERIIKGGKINIDYNYFNNIIQEYIEKREYAKNVFNANKNRESYYDWLNAAQEAFTICIFKTKVYLMYLILVDIAINREQNVAKNKLKDTLSYLLTSDTDALIQMVSNNITNAANELELAENAYILNNSGIKAKNAITEAGNTITEVKTIIAKVNNRTL